jgi:YfiH family protein
LFRLDEKQVYRAESLEQFEWLEHGFGTRHSNGWPEGKRLVTPKQVHSDRVLLVTQNSPAGLDRRLGEGDALILGEPGPIVGIRTADCLPILVVDAKRRSVGAIHAGWRGTAREIAVKTLGEMAHQFGTSPADIWVAIGPGIGPCCFEVGPEVAVQFQRYLPERADFNHQRHLDLAEINRRQFLAAGVPANQIKVSGLCTKCRADAFHSYRREKEKAGRMLSVIGVADGPV